MAPQPKRKYATARQGGRRSHMQWDLPHGEDCPHCHNLKLCHCACPTCGYYRGKEVINVKGSKKR